VFGPRGGRKVPVVSTPAVVFSPPPRWAFFSRRLEPAKRPQACAGHRLGAPPLAPGPRIGELPEV